MSTGAKATLAVLGCALIILLCAAFPTGAAVGGCALFVVALWAFFYELFDE